VGAKKGHDFYELFDFAAGLPDPTCKDGPWSTLKIICGWRKLTHPKSTGPSQLRVNRSACATERRAEARRIVRKGSWRKRRAITYGWSVTVEGLEKLGTGEKAQSTIWLML